MRKGIFVLLFLVCQLSADTYALSTSETRRMAEEIASSIRPDISLYAKDTSNIVESSKEFDGKKYNDANIYNEAKRAADYPNNIVSSTIKEGFLRAGEFEVRRSDSFLDKAKDAQKHPERYVDYLSTPSPDCHTTSEDIIDKDEFVCDEYTVHKEHNCSVGRKIEVDAKHTYVCKKERKTYEKKCEKTLQLVCEEVGDCETGGIVLTSIASGIQWKYHGMILTLGTEADNNWGGWCTKYIRDTKFKIINKNLIGEFRIISVGYDDYMRVSINGVQVYIGPEAGDQLEIQHSRVYAGTIPVVNFKANEPHAIRPCERGRNWRFAQNIDLMPYLKEGENEIRIEVIFEGGGEGWIQIKTRQYCCQDKWSERCIE